ncbi:MAG: tetratricopeptide repeat protein, partial [Candidatus Omnitrophica bacterium]|nr:tetratricopeptide repeat protein [Candidatus Omnitrophota bacterium]
MGGVCYNLRLVAFSLLLALCASGEAAQRPSITSDPDWPLVIAKLRQQMDGMPERTAVRQQLAIAHNNYAVSLADQGLLDDAIRQLQEAVRLEPSNVEFRKNLALIHLKSAQAAYQAHHAQRAKQALDRAIAIAPDLAPSYVLLGELEYTSQRLKEAEAAWQKAVALDPTLTDVKKKLDRLAQEKPVEAKFEKLSQLYFDLRYTEGLPRSASFDIQETLLKARREVGSDFACWPTQKLVVLIYSAEQFRRLRQDTPEWVGGQYD